MEKNNNKTRKKWIDTYKAILIILVVLGHSNFFYTNIIFWFHMPLFFVISGYLWNDKKTGLTGYIKPKLKRFIIPWFTYFIILDLIPMICVERIGISKLIKRSIMFLWSGKMYQGVYWYIPTLILTMIIIYFIEKLKTKSSFILIIIMYITGIIESILFISNDYKLIPIWLRFPWNLDVCLISVAYSFLGIRIRKYIDINVCDFKKKSWTIVVCLSVCIATVLIILNVNSIFDYQMNMKYSDYKSIIMPLVLPFVFGVIILRCSILLSQIPYLDKLIGACGKASIVIMFIHIPIRQYVFIPLFGDQYNAYLYTFCSCLFGIIIYDFVYKKKLSYFLLGIESNLVNSQEGI